MKALSEAFFDLRQAAQICLINKCCLLWLKNVVVAYIASSEQWMILAFVNIEQEYKNVFVSLIAFR